ncbi:MAG: sporulation protein YabP [Firmicutes bacterium]|nr:sporulation protein YabP [Bacillota bacterium]
MPEEKQRVGGDRHQVTIVNRQFTEVTGVHGVESFDPREFVLLTSAGLLRLHGDNLHIKTLSLETGVVSIEGTMTDLLYAAEGGRSTPRARGVIARLFK